MAHLAEVVALVVAVPRGGGKGMRRIVRHAVTGRWHIHQHLKAHDESADHGAAKITQAVATAERGHSGEIRVVIEATPGLSFAFSKLTARDRAVQVFAQERVWDTEDNNGVLLYLLLAERDAEIIADRGLNEKVRPEEWEGVCRHLEHEYQKAGLVHAVCEAVHKIGELLKRAFPASAEGHHLPNEPIVR